MDTEKKSHVDRHALNIVAGMGRGDLDLLLTEADVAKLLLKSKQWLQIMRSKGGGIRFVRVGRSIRYTKAAVLEWLESRAAASTAEYKSETHAGPGRPKKSRHK